MLQSIVGFPTQNGNRQRAWLTGRTRVSGDFLARTSFLKRSAINRSGGAGVGTFPVEQV